MSETASDDDNQEGRAFLTAAQAGNLNYVKHFKAATPLVAPSSMTLRSKKSTRSTIAEEPSSPIAMKKAKKSVQSLIDELIQEIKATLSLKSTIHEQYAKDKKWEFDPFLKTNETVYVRHVTDLIGGGTLRVIEKLTSTLREDKSSETMRCDMAFFGDIGFSFSYVQMKSFIAHRIIDCIPIELVIAEAPSVFATAKTGLQLTTAICNVLTLPFVLRSVPSFATSVFDVTPIPAVKDEEEKEGEEYFWSDKFNSHMRWFYDKLDELQYNTYGRIKTGVFKERFTMHSDLFNDGCLVDGFREFVRNKYVGKAFSHLSQGCLDRICAYEVLNAPIKTRTFFYTAVFNTLEKDYDGGRSGIVSWVEGVYNRFNEDLILRFLQCQLMGMSEDEMAENEALPDTAAYYAVL